LELHFAGGTLKTVEMGSVKTEEQIGVIAARTGLSFSAFHAEIVCLKASALAKNKVVDVALVTKEFERALSLSSKCLNARIGLARLLQSQANYLGALNLLEAERKHDVDASEEARELCGVLLAQADLLEEARAYLERAEKAFPPNGTIHFWLGKVYWALGGDFKSNKDFAMRQVLLAVKGK
jgi:tetratricopeptide (TPR) repeat protein